MYDIDIEGIPAPQGSKVKNRYGAMYEASKRLPAWKHAMDLAFTAYRVTRHVDAYDGPVALTIHFRLPRPKSHYRTGRFAHVLRDDAPREHTQKPDVDKLARAVGDALTRAGWLADDAVVTRLVAEKRWAEYGEAPGAWMRVRGAGE